MQKSKELLKVEIAELNKQKHPGYMWVLSHDYKCKDCGHTVAMGDTYINKKTRPHLCICGNQNWKSLGFKKHKYDFVSED